MGAQELGPLLQGLRRRYWPAWARLPQPSCCLAGAAGASQKEQGRSGRGADIVSAWHVPRSCLFVLEDLQGVEACLGRVSGAGLGCSGSMEGRASVQRDRPLSHVLTRTTRTTPGTGERPIEEGCQTAAGRRCARA